MKKVILAFAAMLVAVTLVACSGQWKSPDGYSEDYLLKVAYDHGYDWGQTFGVKVHTFHDKNGETPYDGLKKSFKSQYFGEIVTSEDNRVYKKCCDELFRGVQEGIRGEQKTYK